MFDLNGFKNYNDTFGHLAGDALLLRLGSALAEAVAAFGGRAYRPGGDEFCVIAGATRQHAIEQAACAALSEHGEGFSISTAFGSVVIPQDTGDATEALRKADTAMYAQKQSGRATAGRQSSDVLMRALAERHPDLGEHHNGVAELVQEVGSRMGIEGEELAQLRDAAALHDVGKVAIPDAIITKPGPLTDDEWEFMRRHTVIGERILAAAPALSAAARLVRSSHEAWDGTGYPDALAGVEIPLGARIIAVCDSFDAMISTRPYAPPQANRERARRTPPLRRNTIRPRHRPDLRTSPRRPRQTAHRRPHNTLTAQRARPGPNHTTPKSAKHVHAASVTRSQEARTVAAGNLPTTSPSRLVISLRSLSGARRPRAPNPVDVIRISCRAATCCQCAKAREATANASTASVRAFSASSESCASSSGALRSSSVERRRR